MECLSDVLERKEKGKTGGAGGPERATAHFGSFVAIEKLCPNKVSLALCRNRVFRVATPGHVHDTIWARAMDMCARPNERAIATRAQSTELPDSMSRHGPSVSQ